MKSKKIFSLVGTVNFCICLAFLLKINIEFKTASQEYKFILLSLSVLFFLVYLGFYHACFKLLKAYKANLDLSKKMKVTGAIFSIIFATLATILLIGTGNFILYYLDKNASHTYTTSSVFSHIIFWGLTISSVYLVAGYWATRKETKLKFIRLVSELGENTVV